MAGREECLKQAGTGHNALTCGSLGAMTSSNGNVTRLDTFPSRAQAWEAVGALCVPAGYRPLRSGPVSLTRALCSLSCCVYCLYLSCLNTRDVIAAQP